MTRCSRDTKLIVMGVLVLVNPRAGFRRDRVGISRRIASLFPQGEVAVEVPESKGELRARAEEAAARGVRLVVAVGGDGTVREVAGALLDTESVLGILPLGSGNGLSRGLGIGVSQSRALRVLAEGKDRAIDVGILNGEPFFNLSGIGFDAVVGKEFDRSPFRGFLPYFGIAARESLQYRRVEVSLRLPGREIIARVFLITVANLSQFGAGAIIAPQADPADGLLDIVVIRKLSAFELLLYAPKLFDGSVQELSNLETYRSRAFRIVRAQKGPVHLDGEPFRFGHVLDYSVLPGALRVRVPA
ncbi:MAG: diacylglycerol kinase family protein [Candidatus Eisenbacteria bacterium]